MSDEKFHLKWHDFQMNISNSLKDLRCEDDFYDVTLVGDDNHQVSAHKVILVTCSQYFKKVLKQNKHSSPLLCLLGLNHCDLKHILDYIYYGEVQLQQEELNRFLYVAKILELDGADQTETSNLNEESSRKEEFCLIIREDECKNDTSVAITKDQPPVLYIADNENLAELKQLISESYSKTGPNTFQCHHCPKTFSSSSHAKDHVESHIEGTNFPCKYCGRSFKTRQQRRAHESSERKKYNNTGALL